MMCLHGFAQGPESWLTLIPPGIEVMAPHLPGHGGEPPCAGFDDAVDALASRLTAPMAVAGYSLGGRLALALCARYPERITGALVVSANPGIEDAGDRRARREWDDQQAALLESEGIEAFVARWEALPMFATQTQAMRDAQRPVRMSHDATALAAAMRSLGQGRMPPLWQALSRCWVPLRIVAGDRDPTYRAIAERMVALAPDASLHVVPGHGHNLLIEAPEVIGQKLATLDSLPRRRPVR